MSKGREISIRKNIILNTIGIGFHLGCQWLLTVLIVRISNFGDAGIYSLAVSFTNVFFVLSSYSVKPYQISDIKSQFSDGAYLSTRIVTCVASLVVCAFCLLLTDYSIYQMIVIAVYMLYKLTESFVDVYHGIEQKVWRLDYVAYSYVLRGIGNLACFYISMRAFHNLLLSIILMLICNVLVIAFYDYKRINCIVHIKLDFKLRSIKELIFCSTPLVVNALLTTFASTWPRLQLEKYYGTEALGVFSSILAPALLISVFTNVLIAPIINIFAKYFMQRDIGRLIRTFLFSLVTLLILGGFCLILANYYGAGLLQLIFGEQIASYTYIFAPMILFTIATAYTILVTGVSTAIREMNGIVVAGIGGAVTALSLNRYISLNGMNGTVYSLVLIQTVQIIILLVFVVIRLHRVGIKGIEQ